MAAKIAAKSPTIIRRAKESLNGIDPVDVKRSYRYEQGFTYELHVRGVADEQRAGVRREARRRHLPEHDVTRSGATDGRQADDPRRHGGRAARPA